MQFHIIKSGIMTLLICAIILFGVFDAGAREFSEFPQLEEGQKIRIGYLEGGPFLNYHQSLVAFVVLFSGMPFGEWLARRISARTFDLSMLGLLAIISVRLIWTALV